LLKNIITTLFSKGFVAIINLFILLVSSKQLGSDGRGHISLLLVNIAIVQIINEIYTGYALVYFIPKNSLKRTYLFGLLWTVICTFICVAIMYILFTFFDVGDGEYWKHLFVLSFIVILHSFHMVIILAKEKIKIYNILNFIQPFILLTVLVISFFVLKNKNVFEYILALYVSFIIVLAISSIQIINIFKTDSSINEFKPKKIITNGFYNQLANLCHMLSNRYNFYLLGNTILVGVYSSATSLIESVWIISNSVSPIILTYIANNKNPSINARLSFVLAKVCFVLSLICVVIIYFIPKDFFVFLLGEDFIHVKTVMLYLSPGILLISFATIISHYFAGLGKQKVLLIANGAGLFTTICVSKYLISIDQLLGASYAACLSYFTATVVLVVFFMKENKIKLTEFFNLKKDLALLKKN
jgi:O-antigen/teichoic acid export membrane protein